MGVHKRPDRDCWEVEREYKLGGKRERVREAYSTKAEAETRDRQLRETIRSLQASERLGQLPDPDAAPPPDDGFKPWWTSCLAHAEAHSRPTTYARKVQIGETHLLPELGEKRLKDITPAQIDTFQTRLLNDGLKPGTVRRIRAELSWCLRRAIRLGLLDRDPLDRVDPVKVREAEQTWTFLDDQEQEKYLKALEQEPEPWRTLLLAALRTGMRVGELVGVLWSDLALDTARITVSRARSKTSGKDAKSVEGPPKSGRGRVVGITPALLARLKELPSRFRGELVFCHSDGSPIDYDQIPYPHERTLERAKIARHVRLHDLRHTWASQLAMRGVPLATIQKLGGWGDYRMVLRYAHLSTESVVDAVNVLDGPRQPSVPTKVPTRGKKEGKAGGGKGRK